MADDRWPGVAFELKRLLLIDIGYCDYQVFVFPAIGHRSSVIGHRSSAIGYGSSAIEPLKKKLKPDGVLYRGARSGNAAHAAILIFLQDPAIFLQDSAG